MDFQPNPLLEKSEEVAPSTRAAEDKSAEQEKAAVKTTETLLSSPESSDTKKKPVGAVSLFGGINVLANKQTKNLLDEADNVDSFLSNKPPPNAKKEEKQEEKVKTNTLSLFDDEQEDAADQNDLIFPPSKPTARNTLKVCKISFRRCIVFSCNQEIRIFVSVMFAAHRGATTGKKHWCVPGRGAVVQSDSAEGQ